jgi:multiple sugar transport system substrate-binding protein
LLTSDLQEPGFSSFFASSMTNAISQPRPRPLPVATILIAAAVMLLAASCARPPEQDRNRIQFAFWGSVQQQRAEEEIIRAFHAAHPEIQVDIMPMGARYAEKIQAMFVGNVAPDVVMVGLFNYDEWASRGVLLDLTEEFHILAEEAEFLPVPRRVVERNGQVFALPINAHGAVTFFNKTALDQAGVTLPEEGLSWEFLEEIAPRLSSRRGDPRAPTDYLMFMPPSNVVFWQHGAALFDDLFHPTQVTVNSPEAIEAVRFLRRLSASGFVVPPEVAADEGTFQLFRDGRVAFYFNGRWMTPEFAGRTAFDWNVVPMPRGPQSNITSHGGTTLAVWSNSKRQEAARKFVRFYASYRGAEIAMHWQRNVPVFREVAYGEEFLGLRPPENMVYFSETMEEGAASFDLYAPGAAEVSRLFNARIQQALSRPQMSAEEIVRGLEEDLNRWLQRMKARGIL